MNKAKKTQKKLPKLSKHIRRILFEKIGGEA